MTLSQMRQIDLKHALDSASTVGQRGILFLADVAVTWTLMSPQTYKEDLQTTFVCSQYSFFFFFRNNQTPPKIQPGRH